MSDSAKIVDAKVASWRTLYTVVLAICFAFALFVEFMFLSFGPLGHGSLFMSDNAQAAQDIFAAEDRTLLGALVSIVVAVILSETLAWAGASRKVASLPWLLPVACMVAAVVLGFPAHQHWLAYLGDSRE